MQPFTKTYKTGAHLFHENDHSQELYILQSGRVRIYRKIGGREVELASLTKGAVIGEMALIDGKPRSASAVACEESTAIMIDAQSFQKRIQGVPSWFLSMIRTTSEKIRKANTRLETIQPPDHCRHAILALHYFFRRYGTMDSDTGKTTVEIKDTVARIMQLLSVNYQCVMQKLTALQSSGLIEVTEHAIVLADETKFDGYCDFLRGVFRKSFDKMDKVSHDAASFLCALEPFYRAQTITAGKGKEIAAADVVTALEKSETMGQAAVLFNELKDLNVLSMVKTNTPLHDASPLLAHQFFIASQQYDKYLLYVTFKDMVPSL
jgi:CRP-like cAMP-binding protein